MADVPYPKFDTPPVVEVVCGVQFDTEPRLRTVDLGAYWDSIKEEFPDVKEFAPLNSVIEGSQFRMDLELTELPPLRRLWFTAGDGRTLIQVQQDRFVYNWRRAEEALGYPSFETVSRQFHEHWDRFSTFVQTSATSTLVFRQFELTYVNHVPEGQGWGTYEHVGKVLADHQRDTSRSRFLPGPEAFKWHTAYRLPNEAGRLHVSAQSTTNPAGGDSVLRLDITARGIAADRSPAGMRSWFDLAHEWIVKGFADITTPAMHVLWGRTQ